MIRRNFLSAFLLLTLVLIASPQAALLAATGAGGGPLPGDKPQQLTEYNPLNITNRGPEKAEGILYFIDGLDRDNRVRDDFRATYPFVTHMNGKLGWDVIAAKFPNAEMYKFSSVPDIRKFVMARLKALKGQGYRKVVLAGQSWGAWISVEVARSPAGNEMIDAILLTAPANYGPRIWKDQPNKDYIRNKTEFVENIKAIRIPTVAIFFKDDEFDPGGRGDITRENFRKSEVPALVIDQPKGFEGHGALWLPPFSEYYASCIERFLKRPDTVDCPSNIQPKIIGNDTSLVETQLAAKDSGAKLATELDLKGKTLIVTSVSGLVTVREFGKPDATVTNSFNRFPTEMSSEGEQICFEMGCRRIYQLSDGRFLNFNDKGKMTGWMVPVH